MPISSYGSMLLPNTYGKANSSVKNGVNGHLICIIMAAILDFFDMSVTRHNMIMVYAMATKFCQNVLHNI